jgi:outer membrane receptor protein involved in Fe transport
MHPMQKRIGLILLALSTAASARSTESPGTSCVARQGIDMPATSDTYLHPPSENEVPDQIIRQDSSSVRYRMNPVIITATKIPVIQQNLAASVSVLDAADLETLPTSAVFGAVQSRVPGLYVTEWGVMGFGAAGSAAGKISMRGTGGGSNSCVLILRDGRPDFMGLMGCTIADEFSTDGVERIEVIRGPGSFLYGTNAIGGVINIIPKRIRTDGFETRLSAGYGEFDSRTLSASHGGKTGRFDYYLTAGSRRTDGTARTRIRTTGGIISPSTRDIRSIRTRKSNSTAIWRTSASTIRDRSRRH